MLERLINVTKTTFFIKNDNFLLKIKNSSQYVLQFLHFVYENKYYKKYVKTVNNLF